MIEVQDVSKRFGRILALDRVSLKVAPGELVVLLGPNGSGKSTLLRCILGIIGYQGSIQVDGLDPLRNGKEVRRRIGYMPQANGLHSDLTVAETLRFYSALRGVSLERGRELLAGARLESSAASKVGELSGGTGQRLAFVLALLADPSVLILDEPTASLDARSRDHLLSRLCELRQEGKSLLLSTHSRQEPLQIADRALTLREGMLEAGCEDQQEAGAGGSSEILAACSGGI